MSFDDHVTFALIWPVGQITTSTFVQHLGGCGHGRGQFLGLFETCGLAFVHDIGLAAIQTAVDEFAARFQNFPGGRYAFGGVGFALSNEFIQFGDERCAFGLARRRGLFVHFDQAGNACFEVCIASQFEQTQEFLDAFAFWRFRACVDARFSLSGDRAHLGPGLSIANGGWDGASATDVALDEFADLGAAFGGGHAFRSQMRELWLRFQFALDVVLALGQAWVHFMMFMLISEGATKNSQQANNGFHFRKR